jgi:hypothetical protein
MSDYMRALRERVGHRLLQIPSVTVLCFDSQEQLQPWAPRVILNAFEERGKTYFDPSSWRNPSPA